MQKAANPIMSDTRMNRCGNLDEQFTPARLALLMGVLMLIAYPEIILGSHAFYYRDAGLFGYPNAYYFRDCFWRGEIPLWNPYSNCGIPFLAQWNTLVLYPPSLFYLLLPMPWSMNFFQLGHMILAAIGMYFLAHRWFGNRFAASVAGLAFAWNGLSLSFLMGPTMLASLAWMPWVVFLLERAWNESRRWIIWAALAGATQMLAGTPEIILFTWAMAGTFFLLKCFQEKTFSWTSCFRFVLVIALVIGLCAAQLLPFFDLLKHGDRSSSYGTDVWSMPPWGVANFLVPLFRCTSSVIGVFSQDEQQWVSSYYAGIAIFALAILAVLKIRQTRVIVLGLLAIAGIFCALGSAGFILPTLKKVVPILGFIRFPIKFIVVTLFCFPLLAAAAIVWLKNENILRARRNLIGITLFLTAGIFAILVISYYFPFANDSWNVTWPNGLSRLGFLVAICGGVFFLIRSQKPAGQIILPFAVLLLLGLDICTHVPRQNPTVITRGYESWRPQMDKIPQLGQSRAMISADIQLRMDRSTHPYSLNHFLGQRSVLLGNCNLLEKIPKVNGFFPVYLHEEYEVEALLYGNQPQWLPNLADFLGASQITSSEKLFVWNSRTNFMPLATIGQQPIFADSATTLKALASPEFQPREIVYLPTNSQSLVTAGRSQDAKIISSRFSPHEILFETESSSPAVLVVAQAYYPLWKSYVDAKPSPLLRANHGFQAIEIPAGRHQVRLAYEDRSFNFGAIISITTLLSCVAALLFFRKQN